MNVKPTPKLLPAPKTQAAPPKSEPVPPDTTPQEPKGDSVVLSGLKGAGKAVLGSAGFMIGGSVGGLKGLVSGAAGEPKAVQANDGAKASKSSKATSLLRHLGAATGLAVGAAFGLSMAPVGLAIAAVTTAITAIGGAAIGGSIPEILPRAGQAIVGGVKGFKDGGVAGWKMARSAFSAKPPAGEKPENTA
jgi:hypothetical protein